ncbi:MAG: 4-hydroxy-tetrahydrodipicolinate synthase [Clostridia bacterium]|nr:4-hydroxy-tetrahydrodipicolinate synthase [Clostridia bacterium]
MLFEGVATALITPFANGTVDVESLQKLLMYQLNGSVDAVVILGTTGEPATMTRSEKELVIKTAVKMLKGKIPVIVGAGSNCTATATENCHFAEELGADGLLCVTPYYNKCTQDGLIRHFEEIANATSLPVICYNVPSRTGVNMLPSTFARLAKISNVDGIKEASGNMEQIEECIRLCEGNAAVYSGDDSLTVPVMAMGGAGVISVVSNVCPKYVSSMTRALKSGDLKKASAMQRDMLPLVRAMFSEVNPIPVKYAAHIKGLCNGELRLPLTELSDTNKDGLKRALDSIDNYNI